MGGEIFPEKPMGSPAVPVVRVLPAAPELAAAMAEAGKIRARLADLCDEFGPSAQSGWSARISLTVLNRYRADAGVGPLSRTPSNDREDTMLRYRRERDEARAELAKATEQLATAGRDADDYQLILAAVEGEYPGVLTADQRKRAGLEPRS